MPRLSTGYLLSMYGPYFRNNGSLGLSYPNCLIGSGLTGCLSRESIILYFLMLSQHPLPSFIY